MFPSFPPHPHPKQLRDSFPAVGTAPSSQPALPVADYAEPDLVQVSPGSPPGPSTFKPRPDEGYALPLVASHYDVPGKHHEYAEPLPPEPEYATPFSEPEPAAGAHRSRPAARYEVPGGDASPAEGTRCCPQEDCPLARVYHEPL